jgi:hypothetical protein
MGVSLQTANPSMGTVTRRPQTTAQPPQGGAGVPFTRLSREGEIPGPAVTALPFGQLWTPPLKPVGGYLKGLDFYVTAVTGGATVAVGAADAPYNAIQNLYLRDPFGQPIVQADGYSLLLINMYSGQVGAVGFGNVPSGLPSYNAISAVTGAFNVRLYIPLELDTSSYCSLPDMNAASQPQIQIQTNPTSVVYSTLTGTAPTLSMVLDEPYWMAPVDNPAAAPPDVGSSAQWSVSNAAQPVGSAQFGRYQLPRVGTYIHTLILVLRDSTGARIDAWPLQDLSLWFDGVPVRMETFNERVDKMFTQFGVTRPTGVIVYTFRNSIQSFVSNGDTYDLLAPTTPATLLEVSGTFQTIANAPAKIQAITGELFPMGGIPYTHLAS